MFLEYWYKALRSESGVVVRVSGGTPDQFRQKLYAERKTSMDPSLDTLSIVMSPTTSDEVWIVKRVGDVPQE